MHTITINHELAMPVYKQIMDSVYGGIHKGTLKYGDRLPSVNEVAGTFSLARGSVFTAYNRLRAAGIIDSVPGKGYFVSGTGTPQQQNIFLLFSTFTPYKEIIYNSLLTHLQGRGKVDIYFHHHNIRIFESLIREQSPYYNTFVIMPEIHEKTKEIIGLLDNKRTFLLDVGLREFGRSFPGVYQDFDKDIYRVLNRNRQLLKKYKRLWLVFPPQVRSTGIRTGFKRFTRQYGIPSGITEVLKEEAIRKNEAYIVVEDKDLVKLIGQAKAKNWKPGKDIGVISYNESELKSVMADGITTITSDFEEMGKSMAAMILGGTRKAIHNPFVMVDRGSV